MQDFKLAESDESFCCWAEYWLCPALYQLCNLASTFLSWWGGGLMTWTNDEWWPVTGVTGDDSGVISVISVWSQVSGLHSITSLSPRNLLFVHWHQHHTEPWSEFVENINWNTSELCQAWEQHCEVLSWYLFTPEGATFPFFHSLDNDIFHTLLCSALQSVSVNSHNQQSNSSILGQ